MKYALVDLSQILCFHQGVDASESYMKNYEKKDWEWNLKFISRRIAEKEGSIASNYYIKVYNDHPTIIFGRNRIEDKQFEQFDQIDQID